MEIKHTPTPWSDDGKRIKGPNGETVADCRLTNGKNDRPFIVRACNAHEELVAAAKDCLQDLSSMELVGASAHAGAVHRAKRLREIIAKAEAQQ